MFKNIVLHGCLIGMIAVLNYAAVAASGSDARLQKSYRFQQGGWTYVHLEGSPAQIGYQHSYLLAPEIADALAAIKLFDTHQTQRDWEFFRTTARQVLWPQHSSLCVLNIGAPVGMAAQIPAGHRSGMREQGVHAGLRLRRIEDELGLAILEQDRIVMIHGHRSVRISIRGDADAEDGEVEAEGQDCRRQEGEKHGQEKSPEAFSQIRGRNLGHDARL